MIPLASITAKILGKRMSKISTQAQEKSGDLNRYLIDLFKNHKIIKIFQRENFEENRSEKFVKWIANIIKNNAFNNYLL